MSQDTPLTTPLIVRHSLSSSRTFKVTDFSTFKSGVESGVTTFQLVTSNPDLQRRTMDVSWRHSTGYDSRYHGCHSHFRPYWRSWFQTIPVYFAREPFEAQHDVRNFTLPDRTSFKKPKSKATLARDRKRMQKFREDKDACSALPFFQLEDSQIKEVLSLQCDAQPNYNSKSKLQSAATVIKKLKTSLDFSRTSNNQLHEENEQAGELVRYLMQSQFENMSKLKNELETEKKRVHKFVAQNVERQREIIRLKTELAKLIDLHSQEVNMRRTLEDKIKRKHRVSLSEKKNGDPLINGSVPIGVGT